MAENIQFVDLRHEQENGIFLNKRKEDKRIFIFFLSEKLSDLVKFTCLDS
jgi:hypothetical protein